MSEADFKPQSSQPPTPHLPAQKRKRDNRLCHCRRCDREWFSTDDVICICGSSDVEVTPSWQLHC